MRILYWNVSSCWVDKLVIPHIACLFSQYDAIAIAEPSVNVHTHQLCNLPGFTLFFSVRPSTSHRADGGVLLYIINHLISVTSLINAYDGSPTDKIWIKILDVIFCFLYLPHANSIFLNELPLDPLDELDGEVLNYSLAGTQGLVLMGDFNAHTGSDPPKRHSVDLKVDGRGLQLLALCESRRLLILNGSTAFNSRPTLLRANAETVIDYAVVSPNLLASFVILNFFDESEHAPISLTLSIPGPPSSTKDTKLILALPLSKPSPLPPPTTVDLALINLLRPVIKQTVRHNGTIRPITYSDSARIRELRKRSLDLRTKARINGSWQGNDRSDYCKIRNAVTSLSRQRRRRDSEAFADKLLGLQSSSAFWDHIRKVSGKKQRISVSADDLEAYFRALYVPPNSDQFDSTFLRYCRAVLDCCVPSCYGA